MLKSKANIFWVVLVALNLLFFIVMGIFVFKEFPDYSLNQKEETRLIGTSYMTMNNEYFQIISEEIKAKVESEGDRVILRDPALNKDRQIKQLREMMDSGVDALIINPVNWKSLKSVLSEAKSKGVHVIIVDSNVYDSDLVDTTIKSDNYSAGSIIGKYFLEQNKAARVVIMSHAVAKSSQDRIRGFIDQISANPNIQIIKEIDCQGQTEIAMPLLQDFINSGEEFDAVFCINDQASLGVVAALDKNNLLSRVRVYGVDASPYSKALIYEGMMEATVSQSPTIIGRETGEALYDLLAGETVDANIDTPVELINKSNISNFNIDRWQ